MSKNGSEKKSPKRRVCVVYDGGPVSVADQEELLDPEASARRWKEGVPVSELEDENGRPIPGRIRD